MNIVDLIPVECKIISLIGMSKNAGKTVTLNRIIEESFEREIVLGLTSVGRDGEIRDVVSNTEKPRIFVQKGTIIATTESLYKLSRINMEFLEVTNYNTSMGKVIIGRVMENGYVQLGGPSTNSQIKSVSDKMISYGASLVVIDGALDRATSASPSIAHGCILSTGAVLSKRMDLVVEKTSHKVEMFNLKKLNLKEIFSLNELELMESHKLKPMEDSKLMLMEDKLRSNTDVLLIDNKDGDLKFLKVDVKTSLNSGKEIADEISDDTMFIVIPGALVKDTIYHMVRANKKWKNTTIAVKDSTKIFVDSRDWAYFKKIGVKIKVLDDVELLAITINPYSPSGYSFNSEDFKEKLSKTIKEIPIINVMEME